MRRIAGIALLATVLSGVAANAETIEQIRIVDEGGIADEWSLVPGTFTPPGYPADRKGNGDNVCLAIGYAITPEGTPTDFTVLQQWSDGGGRNATGYFEPYNRAAVGALSQWRFAPLEGVQARRTITVATMTFRGKQVIQVPGLASQCKVTNLATTLQDARFRNVRWGRLHRDMERATRQGIANNRLINDPAAAQRGSVYYWK